MQRISSKDIKAVKDKRVKSSLKKLERDIKLGKEAIQDAKIIFDQDESGYLETEGLEKSYHLRQDQILKEVDLASQQKRFTLNLPQMGPYRIDYSRNGRYMLIGGQKGHVASFDWMSGNLMSEIQLLESVRDVQWLHNEQYYAVAQAKYVFIYDRSGTELHLLRKHIDVNRLSFLPYHFLLASIGNAGYLHYHDTSTGQLVSELRTRLGSCNVMTQNPMNGILHLGHNNGSVTLWSPTVSEPLVKMLCHKGKVNDVAVDPSGTYMVTAGLDAYLKIWDLRTFKCLQQYTNPRPFTSLCISQKGILAGAHGPNINIYKRDYCSNAASSVRPYMTHLEPTCPIQNIQFCPYEDVLGFGHENGISSILVPGCGEPNYDSLVANPFQTKKQRQESEVNQLLEKLSPDTISLDPHQMIGSIGKLDLADASVPALNREVNVRHKKRSKSYNIRKELLKNKNIMDLKKEKLLRRLQEEKTKAAAAKNVAPSDKPRNALDRFQRKV